MNGAGRRGGLLIPGALALALLAVLLGLGTWQVERKAWKEALIATLDKRASDAAVALPPPDQWTGLTPDNAEFTRVRVRVEFPKARDALVFSGGAALRDDAKGTGYFVFAPATLPGGQQVVINRGFVPTKAYPAVEGPQDIVGALRFPEAPSWFVADHDAAGDIWTVRDPAAMARLLGWGTVAPFYIEQEAPVPPGGLPHPAPLKPQLRNEHLQYAITWYGLAAVLVVMFAVWARRRRAADGLSIRVGTLPRSEVLSHSGQGRKARETTMRAFRFIKAAAVAAVLAATAFGGNARAQTIELKLSHFLPPNHTFHKWAVAWADQLAKESNGRLKVTIYPNGQLVGPPNRQFDAARNGIVDMAFVLHGVTPGRYPMTELVNLAFAWPKAGAGSSVTSKRLTELAPQYLAKEHEGLHILWMAAAMPIVVQSKSALAKLDDFKGVRIRYAGAQNRSLYEAMGATPLLISPPESQDALAKGIIDAASFPYEGALRSISPWSPSTPPSPAWPLRRSPS